MSENERIQTAAGEAAGESELTLEESFQRLDEIIGSLEDRQATLEDSFKAYQEGMKLLKTCGERIDLVEKKVQALSQEGELYEF